MRGRKDTAVGMRSSGRKDSMINSIPVFSQVVQRISGKNRTSEPNSCHSEETIEKSMAAVTTAAFSSFKHKDYKSTFGHAQSTDIDERRLKVGTFLQTDLAHAVIGSAIVLSIATVVVQTDAQAANRDPPLWVTVVDYILLTVYTAELAARLYAGRWWFFRSVFNVLDFTVLAIDFVLEFVNWMDGSKDLDSISFLRIARLARLMRGYRVVLMLPMLSVMVKDLVGAMEAVFWGTFLLIGSLTISSILAVRFINPIVEELTADGIYDGCERCHRAYSTVFHSNLTFLQQIVAGDSWGLVTVPIIEHSPATVFFFIPVLIFINLAIMNVILAVIVESAQEARANDIQSRLQHKQDHFVTKTKQFVRLCAAIDEDGSGDLSLEELMHGYKSNEELAMTMHDMGIEADDLRTIFEIMDEDRSGKVDYKEFAQHIHKMRTADETTVLNFIRHYVMQILRKINEGKSRASSFYEKDGEVELERKSIHEVVGKTYSSNASYSIQMYPSSSPRPIFKSSDSGLKPMEHSPSNGKNSDIAASSMGLKDLLRSEVNSSALMKAEVAALREMCDKIANRVELDLMHELQSISKQFKDQMSILNAIKAQSDASRRREVDAALSSRGGDAARGDRERINGMILPPAHSGVRQGKLAGRSSEGCVSVFSQCTTHKAMHSPRPTSPAQRSERQSPPKSPKGMY